jgi:hypothetical protein
MRVIFIAAMLLLCLFSRGWAQVLAPGAQELHKRYGDPIMERFAVRSGITLTVEYGPDRRACQLLIAPAQPLVELQSPIPPMSSGVVSEVLEELLPLATRGKQTNSNTVQLDAAGALVKTDYENLSIRRFCSFQSCVSSDANEDLRTLVVFRRDTCPTHVK